MDRPLIALIVDDMQLRQWQADAILNVGGNVDWVLLNCRNTRFTRRPFRHALYYLLNIVSLKTPASRPTGLPDRLHIVGRVDFDAEWDGAWQRLPRRVLDQLAYWSPDLAIKFGMGLLRVPQKPECKILSFHHGDPRSFRGRPGGFYELLSGAPMVGQIVQVISNRLDAGPVVAFAQTRVRPDSYCATMAEAYRLSPLLMKTAVQNCLAGKVLPIEPKGKNYRLPSNWTVARFAGRLFASKIRRLVYGAFFEKAWQVAEVKANIQSPAELLVKVPDASNWHVVRTPRQYLFLADPFPHPRQGILVEALRRSDGQGEIVQVDNDFNNVLCSGPGHFSYPGTICTDDECFIVPEVAEWSSPRVYRISGDRAELVATLDIHGNPRVVDPTLYAQKGQTYLFGNELSEGAQVLRLWVASDLLSTFFEHPGSPIRISPQGSRMAGALVCIGDRLCRFGQDCTSEYGDGIFVFEISTLSTAAYEETLLGKIAFDGARGPHTLNFRDSIAVFDFYRERFTPFAGLRRLRARRSKRRARAKELYAGVAQVPTRRPHATQ